MTSKKYPLKYYICFLNLINFSVYKTGTYAVKIIKHLHHGVKNTILMYFLFVWMVLV